MKKKEKDAVSRLKKSDKKRQKSNVIWVSQITLMALVISFTFSFGSETILPNVNVIIGIILVIVFILIGILFDMVGVAVTAASEKPFHSMNAQKIRGAAVAIKLKNKADKVSSFCNDVIGDICGIISGSAGVIVAKSVAASFQSDLFLTTLTITAVIAAMTIGGKALGKSVAMNKSNTILYEFSKILSFFYKGKK